MKNTFHWASQWVAVSAAVWGVLSPSFKVMYARVIIWNGVHYDTLKVSISHVWHMLLGVPERAE